MGLNTYTSKILPSVKANALFLKILTFETFEFRARAVQGFIYLSLNLVHLLKRIIHEMLNLSNGSDSAILK